MKSCLKAHMLSFVYTAHNKVCLLMREVVLYHPGTSICSKCVSNIWHERFVKLACLCFRESYARQVVLTGR